MSQTLSKVASVQRLLMIVALAIYVIFFRQRTEWYVAATFFLLGTVCGIGLRPMLDRVREGEQK